MHFKQNIRELEYCYLILLFVKSFLLWTRYIIIQQTRRYYVITETASCTRVVEWKWNVMAHAQKPDSVFQRNGRVHLYRRGCQFSRLLAAEVYASAVVMLDRPCSDVQCMSAGYPLHSPLSPSLLLPCFAVCHQIPFPLYHKILSKTTDAHRS